CWRPRGSWRMWTYPAQSYAMRESRHYGKRCRTVKSSIERLAVRGNSPGRVRRTPPPQSLIETTARRDTWGTPPKSVGSRTARRGADDAMVEGNLMCYLSFTALSTLSH